MSKGLSEEERKAILALVEASAEALHATVVRLQEMEAKRPRTQISAGARKTR